jgi:hypothetical protein
VSAVELDALPVGSVVRLASGQVFVRVHVEAWPWQGVGDVDYWTTVGVLAEHDGAPTVLYRPDRDLLVATPAERAVITAAEAAYTARSLSSGTYFTRLHRLWQAVRDLRAERRKEVSK